MLLTAQGHKFCQNTCKISGFFVCLFLLFVLFFLFRASLFTDHPRMVSLNSMVNEIIFSHQYSCIHSSFFFADFIKPRLSNSKLFFRQFSQFLPYFFLTLCHIHWLSGGVLFSFLLNSQRVHKEKIQKEVSTCTFAAACKVKPL